MPYLNKIVTEICVDNFDKALQSQESGASRIELCASLIEGGITPALSLTKLVCEKLKIPVNVMIRPRAGDFLYNNTEFELMQTDIMDAKNAGAAGVVFGILNADGSIDIDRCRYLINIARPMQVTFHRAFDMTVDPFLALEEIISIGADILLTSGQRQVAEDGLELIRELVKRSNNRIQVMAGGGVNAVNVLLLHEAGVRSFHFTSRKNIMGGMKYQNEALQSMGTTKASNEYHVFVFDQAKINSIFSALKLRH